MDMELGLRLGEAPARRGSGSGLVLEMGLGVGHGVEDEDDEGPAEVEEEDADEEEKGGRCLLEPPPPQLDLLPLSPSPLQLRFPWTAAPTKNMDASMRGFDVNQTPSPEEGAAASSSPNSAASSYQVEFSAQGAGGEPGMEGEATAERAQFRVSDEEDNATGRKKLRLSKEQSAFLEESFKEHNTLNPKQKMALAKQLNLRPRQVEVWFQNRRARTKLKQTEVDCEYLKRCCQTLTEENRRLQKEAAELRALKTSHPFYMHVPATTLSMCPSCERVASTTSTSTAAASTGEHRPSSFAALFSKPCPPRLDSQTSTPALRQSSTSS